MSEEIKMKKGLIFGVVGVIAIGVFLGIANYNYDPEIINVEAGKPVKIVGNMQQLQGCLKAFSIPQLGLSKVFKNGDNVLEFTPEERGTFGFTCSMGMGTGSL